MSKTKSQSGIAKPKKSKAIGTGTGEGVSPVWSPEFIGPIQPGYGPGWAAAALLPLVRIEPLKLHGLSWSGHGLEPSRADWGLLPPGLDKMVWAAGALAGDEKDITGGGNLAVGGQAKLRKWRGEGRDFPSVVFMN